MGYEIKVIIGELTSISNEDGVWFREIASYDLCKVNLSELQGVIKGKEFNMLARMGEIEKHSIYIYEGDNPVNEDLYGDRLVAFDARLLLTTLKEKAASEEYRRYPPLISLLESMLVYFDNLKVVLFGH